MRHYLLQAPIPPLKIDEKALTDAVIGAAARQLPTALTWLGGCVCAGVALFFRWVFTKLEKMDDRLEKMEDRLSNKMEALFNKLDDRLNKLDDKTEALFKDLKLDINKLDDKMEAQFKDLKLDINKLDDQLRVVSSNVGAIKLVAISSAVTAGMGYFLFKPSR